jgi:hypothetical protein
MPDSGLQKKVRELVKLKSTKAESYLHQHEIELEKFLANGISECETIALQLPSKKSDMELLNRFFRKTISSI